MDGFVVRSGQGNYSVDFVNELRSLATATQSLPKGVLLIDQNVAQLYEEAFTSFREKIPSLTIPATEGEKTLAGVNRVLEFFVKNNCTKQTNVIAVGGGIVQDIATFASHIYYRGVAYTFVPTTLLAMADSCIGAKCGINFSSFKNQLGVFHSPSHVPICTKFLDTLSDVDVASGYGEILKLALTGSAELYDRLETILCRSGLRNAELEPLIAQSLLVKKKVIEEDEYEKDLRRVLNYGHTFGHALESVTAHAVPHGHAVAWGLDLANYLSHRQGILSKELFERIHRVVCRHFALPTAPEISPAALLQASRRDKKILNGKLTMVLLERPGKLRLEPVDLDDTLRAAVQGYLEHYNAFSRN